MANTTESRFGQPLTLALTEKERQELEQEADEQAE